VDRALFWRSLLVQATAVIVLFVPLALLLPEHFFKHWGFLVGPLAWIACSLVSARVLRLPLVFVLFAALAGGVAGTIVLVVVNHWAGLVVSLLVFAASCGSFDPGAEEEPEPGAAAAPGAEPARRER
jgi:hypothetical protein